MEECAGREGAGDEVEDGVEGRGRKRDSAKVQIGAELLCKSGKVGRLNQSTEYGVQITEEPGHKQVGAWLRRVLVMFRRARRSLAPTRGRSPRIKAESANWVRHVQNAERSQTPWRARLARSANPTSIQREIARAARGAAPTSLQNKPPSRQRVVACL